MTHKTVGAHLGALLSSGIYDVKMIEDEFGAYGFTYDRATDELVWGTGIKTKLGARPAAQMLQDIASDSGAGFLETRLAPDHLVVDAVDISRAVYRLIHGDEPPSLEYRDRSRGFRADVKAITKLERSH